MHDLVIRNGQLITPSGPILADLAIDNDRIAAIGLQLNAERDLDASGCFVIPGGVDCHVHLQMRLSGLTSTDSFESGTVAAATGGTTTVIDFTDPQPEQSLMEAFCHRRSEADDSVAVDYGLHMSIPTWHASAEDRLHDVPNAVAAGCATFKLYQAYDRMQLDDVALLRTMRAVASAGGAVVLHSETGPLLDQLRADAVAAGHNEPIWHERTRPQPSKPAPSSAPPRSPPSQTAPFTSSMSAPPTRSPKSPPPVSAASTSPPKPAPTTFS